MASQPPQQRLPLFYSSIVPLNWQVHGDWGFEQPNSFAFAGTTHAVPITIDEFAAAQRHYPVVFGLGPNAAPLALVGLQEGQNLFIDENGQWRPGVYVPAYVRRYPFFLAKLADESTELSLCFDEGSGFFGPNRGERIFEGQEPTQYTKNVLNFCDQFEQSVMRTRLFMQEVEKLDVVIEGEVTIQIQGREQPAVYRGFRMVDENKLREIRGDQARKLVSNGMLAMVYAHLMSLTQISVLFQMQADQSAERAAA